MKLSLRKREQIERLFRRSWVLHNIRDRCAEIQAQLRSVKRRIWPVAHVARLLGVSVRLLWQWTADGVIPAYDRPSKSHRKGITARAIRGFLSSLEAGRHVSPRRQYPSPALEKCRQALRNLAQDELLTPEEFAARGSLGGNRLAGDCFAANPRPLADTPPAANLPGSQTFSKFPVDTKTKAPRVKSVN